MHNDAGLYLCPFSSRNLFLFLQKIYTMSILRYLAVSTAVFAAFSLSAQEVSVAKYKDGKDCAVSFTFDDGFKDNYTMAVPQLEKRGWRGTFWLNCAFIPGEIRGRNSRMTWEQVCDLHKKGHEISNHGWTHKKLVNISREEIIEEIEKNDSAIFVHTGLRPTTFCYANNAWNDEVLSLTTKGRVGTRTRQYPLGEQASDAKLQGWLDKAIKDGTWAVWMTHGLTEGYDHFKDLSRYTSFLNYVKGKEKYIWVGTFREVAAYIGERDAVKLDVSKGENSIEIEPVLSLDPTLYNVPLTMEVEGVLRVKASQDGKNLKVSVDGDKAFFDFNPYGGKVTVQYKRLKR